MVPIYPFNHIQNIRRQRKLAKLKQCTQQSYARLNFGPDSSRFTQAIERVMQYGQPGGWAISTNALRALVHFLGDRPNLSIAEFGAGVSTVFLDAYYSNELAVDSHEHQKMYVDKITAHLQNNKVIVHHRPLWQFEEQPFKDMLQGKMTPRDAYDHGQLLDESQAGETRIPRLFYQQPQIKGNYDAVILDGPNGSGRSAAFALLKNNLNWPCYILIDDTTHYPFVSDCADSLRFNVVAGEILPHEQWILLEAFAKRST